MLFRSIFLNAAANTRGDFLSSEDFFANRASTIVGKIWATQSITFNAQVNVIGNEFENQPLIGIIDTGFNGANPDIDYSKIILGRDYLEGDNNPLLMTGTGNEHGTHILGLIGATKNNGVGIDGINDEAPIWLGRAIGSGQWAKSLTDYVNVVRQTELKHGVVNLSLDLTQKNADGTVTTRYEFTPEERVAIEYARQNNVLLVVAAGNTGGTMSALGQASQEFDNIITVGAIDESDRRAPYSGYGRGLGVVAYGGTVDKPVVSTVGSGADLQKGIDELNRQWADKATLIEEATGNQVSNWLVDGVGASNANTSQASSGSSSTAADSGELIDDEMSVGAKNIFGSVFGQFDEMPESELTNLTSEERQVYEQATQEIDKILSNYLGDASQKLALEYVDGIYETQVNALSQFVEAFDENMAETLIKAQDILKEAGYAVQLPKEKSQDTAFDLGLGTMAGTSVSTAQVTGIASQVWASNPGLSYAQIKDILKKSAVDLGTPGWDAQTGSGKVNLAGAISLAEITQPDNRQPQPIISPLIWSGEGKVIPGERPVLYAVPAFTGNILNAGYVNQVGFLRIRSGPGQGFAEVGQLRPGATVIFDAVEDGGSFVADPYLPGGGSSRWYRIAGTNNWMSGLYFDNTPEQAAQERQRLEAIKNAEEEARQAALALQKAEEDARRAEEELRRIEAAQKQADEELRRFREQLQAVVNTITQQYGDPGIFMGSWVSNGLTMYQFSRGQSLVKPDEKILLYESLQNNYDGSKLLYDLLDLAEPAGKGVRVVNKLVDKNIIDPKGFFNTLDKLYPGLKYLSPELVLNASVATRESFVKGKGAYLLSKTTNFLESIVKYLDDDIIKIGGKSILKRAPLLDIVFATGDLVFAKDEKELRRAQIRAGAMLLGAGLGLAAGGVGAIGGVATANTAIDIAYFIADKTGNGDNLDNLIENGYKSVDNAKNSVISAFNQSVEAAKQKAEEAKQKALELVAKSKAAYQVAQTTVQQVQASYQIFKQKFEQQKVQIVQQAQQKMQEAAKAVVQQVINNPVVKATSNVINHVATYAKKTVQAVTNVINGAKQFVSNVIETGKQIVNNVVETAKQTYETVKTFVAQKVEQGTQFVAEKYKKASEAVSNTWNNVSNGFNGVKSLFGW